MRMPMKPKSGLKSKLAGWPFIVVAVVFLSQCLLFAMTVHKRLSMFADDKISQLGLRLECKPKLIWDHVRQSRTVVFQQSLDSDGGLLDL